MTALTKKPKRRSLDQARADAERVLSRDLVAEPLHGPARKLARKRPRHIEDDHQAAYFRWVDLMARTDARYLNIYAVPNGGTRNGLEAARMKGQGVRPGVFDINVDIAVSVEVPVPLDVPGICGDEPIDLMRNAIQPLPRLLHHGLRIELKRPIVKGEDKPRVSLDQAEWAARYRDAGYMTCVCYGWDQAKAATETYFSGGFVPYQWTPAPTPIITRIIKPRFLDAQGNPNPTFGVFTID